MFFTHTNRGIKQCTSIHPVYYSIFPSSCRGICISTHHTGSGSSRGDAGGVLEEVLWIVLLLDGDESADAVAVVGCKRGGADVLIHVTTVRCRAVGMNVSFTISIFLRRRGFVWKELSTHPSLGRRKVSRSAIQS